jgi:hypothetical protein
MQAGHDGTWNPENDDILLNNEENQIAMKFSLLTNNNRTKNKSCTDSTQAYLKNVAKTIGINVDQEKQHYENSKSFRS